MVGIKSHFSYASRPPFIYFIQQKRSLRDHRQQCYNHICIHQYINSVIIIVSVLFVILQKKKYSLVLSPIGSWWCFLADLFAWTYLVIWFGFPGGFGSLVFVFGKMETFKSDEKEPSFLKPKLSNTSAKFRRISIFKHCFTFETPFLYYRNCDLIKKFYI